MMGENRCAACWVLAGVIANQCDAMCVSEVIQYNHFS